MTEEARTVTKLSKLEIVRFYLIPLSILFDLTMDTYSVVIYWLNKENLKAGLEVAIFSTISLSLGYILGIFCLFIFLGGKYGTKSVKEWRAEVKEELALGRVLEVTFETLPQLWISLYTLSIGFQQQDTERGILYFSTVKSWISISLVLSTFDEVLLGDNKERNSTVSDVEKYFLYSCKSMILLTRMLLIVFMTIRIGWFTALFIGLHYLVVFIVISCRFNNTWWKTMILSIFYVFSWLSGEDSLLYDGLNVFVFIAGHIVGLVVCSVSGNSDLFILLPHFVEIYVAFSVLALFLFAIYLMSRKSGPPISAGPH